VRTRELLRRSLLDLLRRKSISDLSVRDIATGSGIGYATFFRHYASKESLLSDVAEVEITRLIGVSMPVLQATGDLRATTLALCRYVFEHRALWSRLLSEDTVGAMRKEFIRIGRKIAKDLAPPGHWVPAEVAASLVIASTLELFAWWLSERRPMPVEKIAAIYERLVIGPAITSDEGLWLAERKTPRRQRSGESADTARRRRRSEV
jgi:AcrR family transcriptional regulator